MWLHCCVCQIIHNAKSLQGGLHALLEKVKGDSQMTKVIGNSTAIVDQRNSWHVAQDISTFLKKRAFLEESYGRDMVKVAQATAEAFDKAHPKSG